MDDHLDRLALARMMAVSADLQLQLENRNGFAPMQAILARARRQATQALTKLVMVDAEDAKAIRDLQNEVRRYDDLVGFVMTFIAEGMEADRSLSADERDEFIALMQAPDVQAELRALGIEPPQHDEDMTDG